MTVNVTLKCILRDGGLRGGFCSAYNNIAVTNTVREEVRDHAKQYAAKRHFSLEEVVKEATKYFMEKYGPKQSV